LNIELERNGAGRVVPAGSGAASQSQ
jgi:hypothetical protein